MQWNVFRHRKKNSFPLCYSSGKTGQIGINVADPNVGYLLAVQQESAFAKNDINSLRCSHHN